MVREARGGRGRYTPASVPRVRWWQAERPDGDDDTEPGVRTFVIALSSHHLDHLARLPHRRVAMALYPEVSRPVDVEVRDCHGESR